MASESPFAEQQFVVANQILKLLHFSLQLVTLL